MGMSHPKPFQLQVIRAFEIAFYCFALISLSYAVVTAVGLGEDLGYFQDMGRTWADGIYQNEAGTFYGHPPYAVVLYFPLSLLPFEQMRILFVVINLLAAVAVIYLAVKLWGERWPLNTRLLLAAFFLSLAPLRVTFRMGQISLLITALVLAAVMARKESKILAGLLLGLSLCKYTLKLPFFLYFLWRREWKVVATATFVLAALTLFFAIRLGLSPIEVTADYVRLTIASAANDKRFTGTTEIGPLLLSMTGGNQSLSGKIGILLALAGLISMMVAFHRRPRSEHVHLSIVTLYSLWFVYHRPYDSVICILPAALFIGFIKQRKYLAFSSICLAALGLFIVSLPGLLTERLHLRVEDLSSSPAGFLGLHLERIIVLGLFCSLLIFLWRTSPTLTAPDATEPAPS